MNRHFLSLAALLTIGIIGCNSNAPKDANQMVGQTKDTLSGKINEEAEFQFDLTISNIPAPYNLMENLAQAGITYNKDLLNPTSNADKYTVTSKKALAFGVYNVDLGYLAVYNQNQDVINYFVQARKLAKDLGAGPYFDEISGDIKLDKSLGNKDQVLSILDKAYTASDKYLKNNQRLVAATLMLVGGWIESQYVTLNSIKDQARNPKNETIYKKVWEQRGHLANIIKLLEELKSEDGVADVLAGLKDVEPSYKELSQETDLTKEKVQGMVAKVTTLRNKTIQ